MDESWNDTRLRELAVALPVAEDGEDAWLAWVARARPFIQVQFPGQLQSFDGHADLREPPGRILNVRRRSPAQVEAEREQIRQGRAARLVEEVRRQRPQMSSFLRGLDALVPPDPDAATPAVPDALSRVLRILDRFPAVARQLRDRHKDRETLLIGDEHDVQDLLHALLLIDFEDVRAEEWAPSQGGSPSRLDFLLHAERIVVEVKKTRPTLRNKDLTSKIYDDAGRYQKHTSCETLVCFVYDPDHLVKNPRGFEVDHSRPEGALCPVTVVRPQ